MNIKSKPVCIDNRKFVNFQANEGCCGRLQNKIWVFIQLTAHG